MNRTSIYVIVLISILLILTFCERSESKPIYQMNMNKTSLEDVCSYRKVRNKNVYSVRPTNFPWNPKLSPFEIAKSQHSWMIDLINCRLNTNNKGIIPAIQYGTKFKAAVMNDPMISNSSHLRIKMFAQKTVPTTDPSGLGRQKDRFEFQIVPKYPTSIDKKREGYPNFREDQLLHLNGEVRYFAFSIRFDEKYQVPDLDSWVMHYQVHQAGGSSPPMAMRIKPNVDINGPIMMQINLADQTHKDARENDPDARVITNELFGTLEEDGSKTGLPLVRGKWYNFVFQLQPHSVHSDVNGKVTNTESRLNIWLNKKMIFSEDRYWGYDPVSVDKDRMSIKIGTYRRRHESNQIVDFKDVKYGNTLEDVSPN